MTKFPQMQKDLGLIYCVTGRGRTITDENTALGSDQSEPNFAACVASPLLGCTIKGSIMNGSRHIERWRVPLRSAHGRSGNRFMVGTVTIVLLSYLTIGLVCAGTEGMHVRVPGANEPARTTVASQTPAPDSDDELCKFMHEQILTLQATSTGSMIPAKVLPMVVAIAEGLPQAPPVLDAYRPPGPKRAPGEILSFQLYSVLRI